MEIKRKGDGKGRETLHRNVSGDMEYLTFPSLEETGMVRHLFSTRTGGVSEGIFASMNLSYARGDRKEAVDENFRRVAAVLGCGVGDFVCSDQTHTVNVRRVTESDKGKGVTVPKDYTDVDGLITDEKGIVLATFYADCVPLYLADTKNRAIGLSHSGWRGTGTGQHQTDTENHLSDYRSLLPARDGMLSVFLHFRGFSRKSPL